MNIIKIFYLVIITLLLNSCFPDDINQDPNTLYKAKPSALVSYSQKLLSDYMNTPNVNTNNFRLIMQYWQETQYIEESRYDFANRSVSDVIWRENYVFILNNLEKAKSILADVSSAESNWEEKKKAQLAIIDLLQVYTFQNLVDTFGDIPYSKALNINNSLPAYDKGEDIYVDLINRAKKDVTDLTGLSITKSFEEGDLLYNGDIEKWKKFGNSLLLKLAIGIADHNDNLAKQTASDAIVAGLIVNSADNCLLHYIGDSSNYNPLYEDKLTKRNDFIAGKTLVDYMTTKNDPRISKYYQTVKIKDTVKNIIEEKYIGQTIGEKGAFDKFSNIGYFAQKPDTPGTILSYTEIAFYKAEVAARWNIGNPEDEYKNAIKASMKEWGVSDTDAEAYILANPYNSANWKKSIGEQAWVAMYNQGLVSWNFYRRLDYPVLLAATGAIGAAEGKVPVRLQYAPKEQNVNSTNWSAASNAIGGDKLTTRIFWDKQ